MNIQTRPQSRRAGLRLLLLPAGLAVAMLVAATAAPVATLFPATGAFASDVTPDSAYSSVQTGHAVYYSPGMFSVVARNRGMRLRGDVDGYAAVTNCGRVGAIIKARINGGDLETYQVLDCSAPWDRARHISQGIVIEVDYQSAVRNGFTSRGRAPAKVYYP